jgi:transglutaminase-like putative cysteine protease
MTWRLKVRHVTGYTYDDEVVSSFNEARMTPLTDRFQTTVQSRLDVRPAASTYLYLDYWGTNVTSFDIQTPHRELVVTATSVVETAERAAPTGSLTWRELHDPTVRDRTAEWLAMTPRTESDAELADLARSVAGSSRPSEAATAIVATVGEHMEYVHGATEVHTNGLEAWRAKKGVCQDFAHASLAMLRTLGVPARYVSGYLHPKATAELNESVTGESHAWIEWWDGDWVGYDPTNGQPVGQQHVAVARGRDYDDVAPLKGIYSGAASSKLGVVVDVVRLA